MAEEQQANDNNRAASHETVAGSSVASSGQENQDHDQTSAKRNTKLLIIGAVIAAAVTILALLIVILALSLSSGSSCRTVETPPSVVKTLAKPVASQNNRALVRLAGHLEFLVELSSDQSQLRYLDLKLQRVHHSIDNDSSIRLRLETDCATIVFVLRKNYSISRYEAKGPYISSGSSDIKLDQCKSKRVQFSFFLDRYYRCHSDKFYACDLDASSVGGSAVVQANETLAGGRITEAGLQISQLDVEIDGNKFQTAAGHFDQVPEDC